ALTIALHTRAISEDRRARDRGGVDGFFIALILSFLVGVWCQHVTPTRPHAGEIVYKIFMAFYALVVPAYVWLCMVPSRSRVVVPTQRRLAVLAIVILIALPMYWLAFIDNRMIWLVPGLIVVLLARIPCESIHKNPR
ncbi:MAG TPA: hypothetical protein VFC46_14245, partial [Humisphaera sp.]|nr:hypothetical protein [Humisphaera sp.]